MAETNTRQASRAPVTLKIKFKSETLDQFIERYSVDISHGGIFIRTKDPLAVGTSLKFEFQLKDATPLIIGDGTVVWTREPDVKRAGVSPGMGVRFDKLPGDSQKVLDKVLAKKGGKLKSEVEPMEGNDDDDAAGDFVDSPTRVAPAGLVDSLTTNEEYDEGDLTPLPKPMPFHGDAGDFDDAAFDESTKVASLDSILAQAKGTSESDDSAYDEDAVFASTSAPARSSARAPAKAPEPAATPLADYEDPFADLNEPADKAPGATRAESERADTRAETEAFPLRDALEGGETALDEAPPNEADVSSDREDREESSVEDSSFDDDTSELDDDDDGIGADDDGASSTQTSTARAAVLDSGTEDERGSSMPWIAVAAVILLIGGAGGFWLLNKDKKGSDTKSQPAANNTTPLQGDPPKLPDEASKDLERQPEVVERPTLATRSVAISTDPEGATLTVQGTDLSALSPTTFDLEEGKTFTIEVRHSEFLSQTIEVVADGSPMETVKLAAKPKLIRFTTEPPGAIVTVNGQRLKGRTPIDLPVSKRMAAMPIVHVQLRLPGYKVWEGKVDMTADFESGDTESVSSISAKLEDIPRVIPTNNRPLDKDNPDAGAGSTDEPNVTDINPEAVEPVPDKPADDEPTPDWMK